MLSAFTGGVAVERSGRCCSGSFDISVGSSPGILDPSGSAVWRSPGTSSVGASALNGRRTSAGVSCRPCRDQYRAMPVTDTSSAVDLCRFIDSSPSPYHAVEEAVLRLTAAGFSESGQDEEPPAPGRHLVRSGGALVAWADEGRSPYAPLRIVGAHTDSPNLRLKPKPDRSSAGCRQVGVEVYGGALLKYIRPNPETDRR